MKSEAIMKKAEEHVLHTYNRFPVVIERGDGAYITDADGKRYLDFCAGIAVYALGYHYPGFDEALKAQIDKIGHVSNLFYSEPLADAAEAVTASLGMSKVFFTNSGAEAVEGALKAARKYALTKRKIAGGRVIAMKGSFHGRTVGALSVTGNDHYQEAFLPLMGGVDFAEFNDLESVKAAVRDDTCAVIMETVQGEGGIHPADPEFIKGVRELCDEKDILLILDEIQCGMGRTGKMWAFENYGVKPDIATCAKALGCGVPVGAFVLSEKAAGASLVPGDHGSTYGGNPFAMAAVKAVFSIFEKDGIVEKAAEAGERLGKLLDGLAEKYPEAIAGCRGLGLIRGIEFKENVKVGSVIAAGMERGLLTLSAEGNVLRLVPPLIVTKGEIEAAAGILEESIKAAI